MNITFLLGLLAGFGLVIYGMITGGTSPQQVVSSFIDMPSVYITFGGAISATIMSVPFENLKLIPKHLKILMKKDDIDFNKYIDAIVVLAKEARLKGLLVLENKIQEVEVKDDFLNYCVMLIVDALDPGKVRAQIESELACIENRHADAWNVYDVCSAYGPAFGMLGTLIGLINMLANMSSSGGAEALGKGMAVALVTTFYGSVLQNMICAPISYRLKAKHQKEMVIKELVMEGILMIQSGENPKVIEETLSSYISTSERGKEAKEGTDGKKAKKVKKDKKDDKK